MHKTSIISMIILLLFIVGCTAQMKESSPTQQPTPTPITTPSDTPTTTPAQTTTEAPVKEFHVVAKQFEFVPDTITVKKGDKVKIVVTSADVTHGFTIPEYGVNLAVSNGEEKTAEFIADKMGDFRFFCSVPCGEGHSGMQGHLIVNE